ncbi:MAG TPA: hypothetical protein VLB68_00900, partial [Pyrinomonadaceae bacterium]|nr:hypothetical protein [Pyrinomonadaceae bacterium]
MNEIPESKHPQSRRAKTAIVVVVAVVAIAAVAILLLRFMPRGSSGRPVPAPRTIGLDQSASQAS